MKSDAELKKENPKLYEIARENGTEPPFSSDLLQVDEDGVFHCAVCKKPLFDSVTKFDSKTGWPSFTNPITAEAVILVKDNSHHSDRTEVRCKNCNAHLGHVFPDGPPKENANSDTNQRHDRYCINGISLNFKDK